MSSVLGERVEVDGALVAYSDVGEGPPLVFVHGYFLSRRTWRKVIPGLQENYRCLSLDLLAAGESEVGPTGDLSVHNQARMLLGFLDALELQDATLIAHDSGGVVTRLAASLSPSRVKGLVLCDTEIPGRRVRSFKMAERLVAIPPLVALFRAALGSKWLWNRLLRAAIHDLANFDGEVAEGLGAMLCRFVVLVPAGCVLAYLLAGSLPTDAGGLWLAVPLALLASVVNLLFMACVGTSAFWLGDTSPFYWIWQKCAFVLGGLLLPLDIYPEWLRRVAELTPFSSLMYGPGSMAFGLDPLRAGQTVVTLLVWGAIAVCLLAVLYRRGLRVLDVAGG